MKTLLEILHPDTEPRTMPNPIAAAQYLDNASHGRACEIRLHLQPLEHIPSRHVRRYEAARARIMLDSSVRCTCGLADAIAIVVASR